MSTDGTITSEIIFSATIHEVGDIRNSCADIGAEITSDLTDAESKIDIPMHSGFMMGAPFTWTQPDFKVPLKDILGNSILITDDST